MVKRPRHFFGEDMPEEVTLHFTIPPGLGDVDQILARIRARVAEVEAEHIGRGCLGLTHTKTFGRGSGSSGLTRLTPDGWLRSSPTDGTVATRPCDSSRNRSNRRSIERASCLSDAPAMDLPLLDSILLHPAQHGWMRHTPTVRSIASVAAERRPTASAGHRRRCRGGQAPATADADRPVNHAELQEHDERGALVNTYRSMLESKFDAMLYAMYSTCAALESHRPKRTDLLVELVNMAAGAAIAGAAGVVAEILAKRMASNIIAGSDRFKQTHQRFATDAIKDSLKKSFHVGISTRTDVSEADLARAFRDAQFDKFQVARSDFFHTFYDTTGRELGALPVPALREAVERQHQDSADPEIRQAAAREIAVEWTNLVARVHHGAGGWDPWAGEHGSAHAVPTHAAAAPPDFDHPSADHPSTGNVDPGSASIEDVVDDDQRVMNPTLHGMLEINLWADGYVDGHATHFSLYQRGGGMRLAGVSDHVKRLVAQFPAIRDLKMNKVVAVYNNDELNPPKPTGRFLITADGFVRRSAMDGDEIQLGNAAEFAQDLSPALLR